MKQESIAELLKPLRDKIDIIDDKIIDLLSDRMDLVRQVGHIKANQDIDIVQQDRVVEVRERCAQRGALKGLNPGMIRNMYNLIIDDAHENEQAINAKQ